jgi:hypothetical protein
LQIVDKLLTAFLRAQGIPQSSNPQATGRRLKLRFAKASHFVFVPLLTMISATGVAGARTTTRHRQFDLSFRFICYLAHQSQVPESPQGITFWQGRDLFLAEDSSGSGRPGGHDFTGQLIPGFNSPLPFTGAVTLAHRAPGLGKA